MNVFGGVRIVCGGCLEGDLARRERGDFGDMSTRVLVSKRYETEFRMKAWPSSLKALTNDWTLGL